MKTKIVPIGNSQGVRIPKPFIEECGLTGDVEMVVKDGCIVISPAETPRQGWDEAFKDMALNSDAPLRGSADADRLLIDEEIQHDWDDSEWQW
ncbi:MAG: AbrB/MazE/SpoVT family DNA-binding domain-containing protein [Prochloraceae cyanobacterium]|nr:AbrB/MazE/SpoVT family DNA-binding domain-containing protein [Prochloraceae cyanobacterium]